MALIVGAVGVANIMIISVLERRSEIGLRRALGATKSQIRTQFLGESILLAAIGGIVGVLAGAMATVIYASSSSTGEHCERYEREVDLYAADGQHKRRAKIHSPCIPPGRGLQL